MIGGLRNGGEDDHRATNSDLHRHRVAYSFGLTGNIGTGKSTVLQMLADLGAQIIDADKLAHEVIALGGPTYAAVEVYTYE